LRFRVHRTGPLDFSQSPTDTDFYRFHVSFELYYRDLQNNPIEVRRWRASSHPDDVDQRRAISLFKLADALAGAAAVMYIGYVNAW
jgi:hypothetical protein